ncbi:MazG-like family protein [Mannheimia haemolytica]|uniref:MazG-like family protein n=1 Tax=Mannheimia haemolytica TaxID=75985 RepID=UPI0031F5BEE9
MQQLIKNIEQWAEDRNLINGSTPQKQMLKLMEEFGELCGGIARNNPEMIKDAIGDLIVVCIIKAKQEKQPIYPVQFENHRLNGYRFDISVAVHCLYDIERIKDRGKYSRFFGILHHLALELSNQVQRFFEVNFIRCFPTQTFTRS